MYNDIDIVQVEHPIKCKIWQYPVHISIIDVIYIYIYIYIKSWLKYVIIFFYKESPVAVGVVKEC